MIEKYEITIDRPEECPVSEFKDYIKEAIDMWRFGGNPNGVLFGPNLKIKVKRMK